MKQENTSAFQVVSGVVLGVVLQPLAVVLILAWIQFTVHSGEGRGWLGMGAIFGYFYYFGMAQALIIVPLSLVMLAAGKHGVVRGLLYTGTALALLNIGLFIANPHLGRLLLGQ